MTLPAALLSRVEDAGLNASAPPAQWWVDGWLVRAWPGKARRARCVNALMPGVLSLDQRLEAAQSICQGRGVPLIFRITPFTRPGDLPLALAERGYAVVDPTLVLVRPALDAAAAPRPLPAGISVEAVDGEALAEIVGALRQSPQSDRQSHAQRLAHSPAPYLARVLRRQGDGCVLACGQVATESAYAGLYDVFTHPEARNSGLATALCEHLLADAVKLGAKVGYLQVDAANGPALAVYRRLGFVEGYGYHYLERTKLP